MSTLYNNIVSDTFLFWHMCGLFGHTYDESGFVLWKTRCGRVVSEPTFVATGACGTGAGHGGVHCACRLCGVHGVAHVPTLGARSRVLRENVPGYRLSDCGYVGSDEDVGFFEGGVSNLISIVYSCLVIALRAYLPLTCFTPKATYSEKSQHNLLFVISGTQLLVFTFRSSALTDSLSSTRRS
jgi:hypothetical protein